VGTVVSRTEDEERTQRYRVFEVSELGAEKALRSYLRDRDEKITSLRIRERSAGTTERTAGFKRSKTLVGASPALAQFNSFT
jgi:hypothetical protein